MELETQWKDLGSFFSQAALNVLGWAAHNQDTLENSLYFVEHIYIVIVKLLNVRC